MKRKQYIRINHKLKITIRRLDYKKSEFNSPYLVEGFAYKGFIFPNVIEYSLFDAKKVINQWTDAFETGRALLTEYHQNKYYCIAKNNQESFLRTGYLFHWMTFYLHKKKIGAETYSYYKLSESFLSDGMTSTYSHAKDLVEELCNR